MRAQQNLNLKRCYYVVTGDLYLLKRNLLACLQEVTSSLRLFGVARSGLQIIKYFSHRHKLQRLEAGLKGAACFKIFQVISKANLASFKCQMHVQKYMQSCKKYMYVYFVLSGVFIFNYTVIARNYFHFQFSIFFS